eukprot:10352305-Prorocentrum_lima.AAC.1
MPAPGHFVPPGMRQHIKVVHDEYIPSLHGPEGLKGSMGLGSSPPVPSLPPVLHAGTAWARFRSPPVIHFEGNN